MSADFLTTRELARQFGMAERTMREKIAALLLSGEVEQMLKKAKMPGGHERLVPHYRFKQAQRKANRPIARIPEPRI